MTDVRPDTWQWGEEEPFIERLIFTWRPLLLVVFLVATVILGWQATRLQPDASFEKMIPVEHPYVQAMLRHLSDLGATGTTVQIAVEHVGGDIFDAQYLDVVQQITDEVFYLPGVDCNRLRSLWTPNVRWTEVTEEGFEGDQVICSRYDGGPESMDELRLNLLRSGEVGRLVANDFTSSIVEVTLFDRDPRTGEPMDYWAFAGLLESEVRAKYQSDDIRIYIVGFAKMVGDLLEGIRAIAVFAFITFCLTALLLFLYSRSVRATAVALLCSLVAVTWQLGLLQVFGYGMDAFSVLVPFLVFAIAISHGVQMVNATAMHAASGATKTGAAKLAFRGLYLPGTTALVSDAVGFLTMLLMPIQVIRELGITASIGVAVIIISNLVLLPLLLSYSGLGSRTIERLRRRQVTKGPVVKYMAACASRPLATVLVVLALCLVAVGIYGGRSLQIGDLDAGAPELRADSRYNLDSAYITSHYSTSSDILVILVETAPEACSEYSNMKLIDEFLWTMANVPGVESALGSPTVSRLVLSAFNEGSLKWATITRNQAALNSTFNRMPEQLMNRECSLSPAVIYLADHKAETLNRVMRAVEDFAADNDSEQIRFVPAAGNAGIEAATNQEIARSQMRMLYLVYGAVAFLVLVSFGSLRAVACIILPLALTSVLCQALMAYAGIGVKVATLPVIALGVGVGVDYGIYVFARLNSFRRRGMPMVDAWSETLSSTGKAVAFTGFTLAIGVATWMFSPIKFQADMGLLLTFMFLLNMVGALTLLPALASFLYPQETLDE